MLESESTAEPVSEPESESTAEPELESELESESEASGTAESESELLNQEVCSRFPRFRSSFFTRSASFFRSAIGKDACLILRYFLVGLEIATLRSSSDDARAKMDKARKICRTVATRFILSTSILDSD